MSDTQNLAEKTANPAKTISLLVLAGLVVFLIIYSLSDRLAPSSSRGLVSAHVAQIAPRVSGQVINIMVDDNAVVEAGAPLFALDHRPSTF